MKSTVHLFVSLLAIACLLASARVMLSGQAGPTRPAATAQDRPSKLFKDSRRLLATFRAAGRKEVSVLLAAVPGAADAVAREGLRLGGSIRYRDDQIGYVRVRLPIDRVESLVADARVQAAAMDFDFTIPYFFHAGGSQPSPFGAESAAEQERRWPPVVDDYPLARPFSPHGDLDADTFLARHPTWDGRGVTVAVLDGHFDFLVPEMQLAWSLDGRPVPKLANAVNATDPREDAGTMPQWVDMREQVTAQAGRFSWRDKTWTAPRDGAFRIGVFSERRFDSPENAAYINQDIDRNGNPKEDDGQFGVLWDEATGEVWVDTNRDVSFADGEAMADYRVRRQIGVFGKDKPGTAVRESIGFTVQIDQANKFISINVGLYQHSSLVVGSLAGNRRPNGRFDGVAPGARVVSIFYGIRHGHAMVEGLITAFNDPAVDIVLLEQNSTLGNDYVLSDARHLISVLCDRLVERTGKPLLVPGSNSPGLNLVDEPGLSPRVISVGGYQSQESYRVNFGVVPADHDNMHFAGMSHGPSGAGALKPDVLAPSGHIGNDPGYRMGTAMAGLFQLPPGYMMGGGTSQATPVAAGAVALLVSAAKQAGVPYDAARLKAALTASARWIPKLGAFEQGNGLIQVAAAWEMLTRMAAAPPPFTIEGRAPVQTVVAPLSDTPHEGVGIYEREGWAPGASGDRVITLTRTSGPAQPQTFALAWQGNDGTFQAPASVSLPLGRPVPITLHLSAGTPGVHSAILSLTHPAQPGFVHRILNTIVAAERFTAEKGWTLALEGEIPRPGARGFFVLVPPGVPALKVDLSAKTRPGIRFGLLPPDRGDARIALGKDAGEQSMVIERPTPGVWEINVHEGADGFEFEPGRPQPVPPTPVRVNVTLLGFNVAVSREAGSAGASTPLSVNATSRFGAVRAALGPLSLGAAVEATRTIAAGEQQVFEVQVPKGADGLWVRTANPAAPASDLDLYLFNCTGEECELAGKSSQVGADEWIRIASPAPGRWLVLVDGFLVPGGRTDYEYRDVVTAPGFGSVNVADSADDRKTGSTWSTRGQAWVAATPEAPRELVAIVPIFSPSLKATMRMISTPADPPALLGFGEMRLTQRQTLRPVSLQ